MPAKMEQEPRTNDITYVLEDRHGRTPLQNRPSIQSRIFDWLPKIANADLGKIGTISTAIAILTMIVNRIAKRKHR